MGETHEPHGRKKPVPHPHKVATHKNHSSPQQRGDSSLLLCQGRNAAEFGTGSPGRSSCAGFSLWMSGCPCRKCAASLLRRGDHGLPLRPQRDGGSDLHVHSLTNKAALSLCLVPTRRFHKDTSDGAWAQIHGDPAPSLGGCKPLDRLPGGSSQAPSRGDPHSECECVVGGEGYTRWCSLHLLMWWRKTSQNAATSAPFGKGNNLSPSSAVKVNLCI